MSTVNNTPPSEEVDLGQLFKMVGNAFNRLFRFIGSIFNALFLAFVWIVFFIKEKGVIFSVVVIIGLVLGAFVENTSPTLYKSTLTLKQNYDTGESLYKSIDFYNGLLKDKDINLLGEILGLSDESAEGVVGIDLEPVVTENDKVVMFNKYMKGLDSLAASKIEYDDYIDNIAVYKYDYQKLTIVSKQRENFKDVFANIVKLVSENPFFINEQSKDLSQLQNQKAALEQSLLQSDSLQRTYKRVLEQQLDLNPGAEIGITFEGSNDKNQTREFDLYKNDIDIRREIVLIERRIKDKSNIIEIISSDQDGGHIDDTRNLFGLKIPIKYYYVIALLLLSFLLLSSFEFYRFLERYKPE